MSTAFITVLLTDSYLPGALVLSEQLAEFHPTVTRVILISHEISATSRTLLESSYDEIVILEKLIKSSNLENLQLFDRLDLKFTLSKINIFNLTKFGKLIYFDADVLPVKPLPDTIFGLDLTESQVAASPDASWPDIFNSGFLVVRPSEEKFAALNANLKNSFDGADQGLLNQYFKDWVRLPFLYNVTVNYSVNHYEYLPALNHFREDIYNVHFIGARKPWVDRDISLDSTGFYKKWWDTFNIHFTDIAGQIFNPSLSLGPSVAEVEKKAEKKPEFAGGPEGHKLNDSKLVNKWDEEGELEAHIVPTEDPSYPPPIFPWEEHRVKATRTFGPDSEYLETVVLSKLDDLEVEDKEEKTKD